MSSTENASTRLEKHLRNALANQSMEGYNLSAHEVSLVKGMLATHSQNPADSDKSPAPTPDRNPPSAT
jgi:hypothetical protein